MNKKLSVVLTLITLFMTFSFSKIFAKEFTVSPGGSISRAVSKLKAGDTLLIKAGTYRDYIEISGLKGTKKKPIVIKGEKGTVLEATGRDGILFYGGGGSSYVTVEGLKITGAKRAGIIVNGSHHITIKNCTIKNNRKWQIQTILSSHVTVENCDLSGSKLEHGIYFSTTDFPIARGNRIHHNAGCGIHMNGDREEGGDGMITGGIIEKNHIFNNGEGEGGAALNMDGVEKTVVRNNLIYGNHAGGIALFYENGSRTGAGNSFLNNTVYFEEGKGRWCLQVVGGAKDTTIYNNIFYGGRYGTLYVNSDSSSGLNSDFNLFFNYPGQNLIGDSSEGIEYSLKSWRGRTVQDLRSVNANPLFVSPNKSNFQLKKTSPCIDRGRSTDVVREDIEGVKRPNFTNYDIGAYEYNGNQ